MVSLRGQKKLFVYHLFYFPFPNSQDKKFHMVASEHPEVIERRRCFIAKNVLDPEEASEDGSIDDGGAALDEEDESGS